MRPSRSLCVALAVALILGMAVQSRAGVPMDQVRASVDKVIRILQDPALKSEGRAKDRRVAIREAASEIFDFHETARRALGRHWQRLTDQDRAEFVPLFADLLERVYISKIEGYSGEKIGYVGESVDPGGDLATVRTTFLTRQGAAMPIDYRLFRRDGRWMVYDLVIEGVSLVANYRAQFDKIIQTASYHELVKKLKAQRGAASATPGA